MVAAGIGIVLGLIVLFFGMAFLEQERKDKLKIAREKEQKIQETESQDDLARALVDSEETVTFADIRRAKLGAVMVAQGVLLTVCAIAFFIIHRYLVPIKWYISVPVLVVILAVSLFTDTYMMGGKQEGSSGEATEADSRTEVADCTEKQQDEVAQDAATDDEE